MEKKHDSVNHPKHYTQGKFEVIDVIEDWKLNFHLAQVVKYVGRAGHKDDEVQDLQKAAWYLDRYIKKLQEADKEMHEPDQAIESVYKPGGVLWKAGQEHGV